MTFDELDLATVFVTLDGHTAHIWVKRGATEALKYDGEVTDRRTGIEIDRGELFSMEGGKEVFTLGRQASRLR